MNLQTATSASLAPFRSDCFQLDREPAAAWSAGSLPALSFARAEGCCDPDPDPDPDPVMLDATRVPAAAAPATKPAGLYFAQAEGCCDPDPDPDPDPVMLHAILR